MLHLFNPSSRQPASWRRGFTMIEIMVVVGVIAVLIAILVPTFTHVRTIAQKGAAVQQLDGLQLALQAYYSDFGMYPPSTMVAAGGYGNIPPNRGSVMLAQGLMGFLPAAQDGYEPAVNSSTDPPFGFRTRTSGLGKIYGPYASADHKTYVRKNQGTEEFFVDPWGNEILYFRALPNAPANIRFIFGSMLGPNAYPTNCYFVKDDCEITTTNPPAFPAGAPIPDPSLFAINAGITGFFNLIHPSGSGNNAYSGGSLIGSDSYLLISAGPDGIYFTGDDIVVGKH